ncbi:kinesin light chain [Ceratobasidium sp. AG-Ba]|nr:kinesin light chain [Ceratobasidium sp. AG-Ba]QRW11553.1 kinesin light chain [Ceratobasidium sp. AG-Ba]
MPVDRAIHYYLRLTGVFSDRKLLGTTMYKTTKLKNVLKGIVKDVTGDENAKMMVGGASGEQTKTMIFARSKHNMNAGMPRIFRSYQVVANQMPDCALWEAVSASMAHPELFKAVEIGDAYTRESFIDGGLGSTNPTAHVLIEAKALFPNRHLSALVCIGAGHSSTIEISEASWFRRLIRNTVLQATKRIAEDAEQMAQNIAMRFRSTPGVYFRFSVDQGMQRLASNSWEKLKMVTTHTRAYMHHTRTNLEINQAVRVIGARKGVVKMEHIDGEICGLDKDMTTSVKLYPAPTPVFTGREDIISQIAESISHGNRKRCVSVLYGLGGSGKTQLALKMVEVTHDMWSDIVFVDATTKETATAALASFAKKKRIGESHENALNWLSNRRERWLMVVDNADDPTVNINQYLPAGTTGSILITTRIEQYALLACSWDVSYRVANMRPEEALALLFKMAGMSDSETPGTERIAATQLLESKPVSKNVGYLALAIVQAGAYIFVSKRSIAQYLEMLIQYRKETLEKYNRLPARIDSYHKTVYTTWHMSYVLLGEPAQRLLHLMAFMHHTEISEETFRRAAINLRSYKSEIPATESEIQVQEYLTGCLQPYIHPTGLWNSSAFVDSMTELLSYSLISFDKLSNDYSLHVLVHDWARTVIEYPSDVATQHTALLLAVSVDYAETMESLIYKRMVEVHVNRLLAKYSKPTPNTAVLLSQVYRYTGKYSTKLMLDQIAVDGRRLALGEEHDATLVSKKDIADNYLQLGRYKEAAVLLERVVEIRKRVSGHEHPKTLIAMRKLADAHHYLGRYNEAHSLQTRVLDISIRFHGLDHPETLESMYKLAVTYQSQGRCDQAEALLLKVVDATKRVEGDEHPDTLDSIHALASTYCDQGRHDEAEPMQEYVVQVKKRRQGDEHPSTLASMNDLALTYRAQSRYGEAEELQVKVLEARKRAYGEDHPETLANMHNLACTYRDLGRYEEAEELGKRVVDGEERALGAGHPSRLISMRNLLRTYREMGERRHQQYETLQEQIQEFEASTT